MSICPHCGSVNTQKRTLPKSRWRVWCHRRRRCRCGRVLTTAQSGRPIIPGIGNDRRRRDRFSGRDGSGAALGANDWRSPMVSADEYSCHDRLRRHSMIKYFLALPRASFRVVRFNPRIFRSCSPCRFPRQGPGFIFMLSPWFITACRSAAPSPSRRHVIIPCPPARQKK